MDTGSPVRTCDVPAEERSIGARSSETSFSIESPRGIEYDGNLETTQDFKWPLNPTSRDTPAKKSSAMMLSRPWKLRTCEPRLDGSGSKTNTRRSSLIPTHTLRCARTTVLLDL